MKAASSKQIKDELKTRSKAELLALCSRLARFKKENKELLTYLLFEAQDEQSYIDEVKLWMTEEFVSANKNKKTHYHKKKAVRQILKNVKKYIRYSGKKETEVILLIAFCKIYRDHIPLARKRLVFKNIYDRQVELIKKRIPLLHEDLQYDFGLEVEELKGS